MSGVEFIEGTVLTSVLTTLEIYDRAARAVEVFPTWAGNPRRTSSPSTTPSTSLPP
ncbi:hypothetical protein B0T18DRAFT_405424 [Schizothecium vesticola]|uniref:REJ domain-containing protein n=1 Tax=Schizothecium vesticola TaxID=314040 RepID=A0AA40K7L7_9PEZI|nr:hypothetical protein B0T18DRAFT_405424 [Schizothecium vesticola]